MSKKYDKGRSAKLKPASNQTDEVSSSDGQLTLKIALTSNKLSKYNNVNKERNKRKKGVGAVSKKDNKKKCVKPKPASSQTDAFSSSDGEYIVYEASYNGDDNYSDEEDHDGDTDDLEIFDH